ARARHPGDLPLPTGRLTFVARSVIGLARIIHERCIASLVLRLHTAFAALANTESIPVGRRKAV
ncbi:MAG: hypothetical protein OXR73_12235, partial [Myxococcales bacterium]|nr:hypothetical protein [Myxococcales bacterium]